LTFRRRCDFGLQLLDLRLLVPAADEVRQGTGGDLLGRAART
jgi:hypothetical protein